MKRIIILALMLFFLLVITEYAYAAADYITNINVTGSPTSSNIRVKVVNITRNGVVNISVFWRSGINLGKGDANTWLQYGRNTTSGDDSDNGSQTGDSISGNITTSCAGGRAFKIIRLYGNETGHGNNTNSCNTGQAKAHGCLRDNAIKTSGFNYVINLSTEDSVAANTQERFIFTIKSCNISGAYDIGWNRSIVTSGTYLFNKSANITVASMLFRHPATDADRATYYTNTTTPAANQTVNLSLRITNEVDIKFHIFSTNVTGSWKNRSASKVRTSGSADSSIVNWSTLKINTSCAAAACTNTKKVGWRFYANDSSTIFNASAVNIINPQAPVTDSCTPPGSGDWVITDTCYKSNTNIDLASGGRVLILAGGLLICDRANVTAAGQTPTMIILGQSLTKLITKGASNC